jgi:mRNA-degrading endonuclease RelE of RelBE toxin-antitoxin system
MNCDIIATPSFRKAAKVLSKKYPSLSKDLIILEEKLLDNPEYGTPLGGNTYKIRVAITSKGKGKSGGARVITFVEVDMELEVEEEITNIYLLTIYDKSETDSVTTKEIDRLIKRRFD